MNTIAELREVDAALFRAEVSPHYRPAVLRGVASDWPAVSQARKSADRLVYSGGAHGVCEKCAIRRSGRSPRSIAGVSVRW